MASESGTFGEIRTTNTVFRHDGVEARADEFQAPWTEHTGLLSDLPDEALEALDLYPFLVGEAVRLWHMHMVGAAGMIVNHATNDLLILLNSVRAGDGRTAARTARVMFEHLVHYKEIAGQPDRAEQYEAHQHVTAMQIAERKIGLRLLRGTAARRERERLKKLARSSGERRNAAVAKYGGRFRSGWTAGVSLLDLAKRHGLEPDYEAYRILSGVMHGSSGSLMGTRRTKGDEVTHRLGPDFQLVPIAFLEGMQWWRKLLDELPANGVSADFVLDAMTGADQLLSHYADIHATCWRVDSRTWPEGRVPPRSAAVLAVYASGATKWFSHDPVTQSICLADLVSDEPDYLQDHLGKWRAQAASVPGGRPLTIHVMGVEVKPRPGAAYAPAGSVLNPRDVQERLGLGAG